MNNMTLGDSVAVEGIGEIETIAKGTRLNKETGKVVDIVSYTIVFNYSDGNRGRAIVEKSLLVPLPEPKGRGK